ncbi:ABC transporter ATP-binding protein [Phreatobacter stygius]|uniref:ABC transporter ATP-binding protein n=1 Tax=Phreatobacter stygius TaxID=1940610 RepID=A0A4D7B0S9_9HYPH|nr:ABC transporter ATP-binding protein [Phreatobacter stygius]QCI64603.1 ABC transporter ATP-binding protein [Phreatobacter stygius]
MAESKTPIVEIRQVSKVFQLQDQTIHALSDANLSIRKGEFVCLIGASGCGKSTLLRIIAGFEAPSAGKALMWGRPIGGPEPTRGMVFQDYALFPWLSVRDNIGFGPQSRGLPRSVVRETVDKFIELVGLSKFANAYPHQLSGGMKQRVAIARVLANDAEVVLMDEPFGALDAMTRERLQDELLDIWQRTGLTVVFVTHSIEEAIFLSNRVVVMTPGPGRIESDNALQLARPRDVSSPAFNDIRRVLGAKLHSHHGKKAA